MQLLPEKTGKIIAGKIIYDGQDLLKKSKNEMRLIQGHTCR
jgi:peptide/nickel transport system ATP-binding protein